MWKPEGLVSGDPSPPPPPTQLTLPLAAPLPGQGLMEDGCTRLSESRFTWSEDKDKTTRGRSPAGKRGPCPLLLCHPASWDWGQDCEHRALISNMLSRCENAKGSLSIC